MELTLKHVAKLSGNKSYGLSGGWITNKIGDDDWDSYNLGANYYFSRKLSVGADLALNRYEQDMLDSDDWNVRTQYFINPGFALVVELIKSNARDDSEDDAEFWNVRAVFRL